MKVLLDSCVWGHATTELRNPGHDVEWCGDWSADPGDEQILASAYHEGRVLVTLDKELRRACRSERVSALRNHSAR
jgi:predicted nuclease of predicted toxin-antitoxin system